MNGEVLFVPSNAPARSRFRLSREKVLRKVGFPFFEMVN